MKCGWKVIVLILLVSGLNTQTFKPSSSWSAATNLGTQVTLKWQDDSANKNVLFRLEKSTAGFAAVGLGSAMASGDVVIIEKNVAGNSVSLKNCKLRTEATPNCTEASQDYTLIAPDSFSITPTSMIVEFKRSYNGTPADGDKPFYNGDNNFMWAYTTSDTLVKHDISGGKGLATITLNLPSQPSASASKSGNSLCLVTILLILSGFIVHL